MSFFLKDANNKVTNDEGKTVKEYTLNKVPEVSTIRPSTIGM